MRRARRSGRSRRTSGPCGRVSGRPGRSVAPPRARQRLRGCLTCPTVWRARGLRRKHRGKAAPAARLNSGTVPDTPAITEKAVSAAVDAALAAIASAADSASLKAARAAHAGEHSPLAQLNATLRDVPADQKAAAGKLVGEARGKVNAALAAQEAHGPRRGGVGAARERSRRRHRGADALAGAAHGIRSLCSWSR